MEWWPMEVDMAGLGLGELVVGKMDVDEVIVGEMAVDKPVVR